MSRVTCHMSLYSLSKTVLARDLQFSHNNHYTLCVQCHMSGVTCQVLHVTYHVSRVMYNNNKKLQRGLSWLVEALLSTGPTLFSFYTFSYYQHIDTKYLFILTCSGPF